MFSHPKNKLSVRPSVGRMFENLASALVDHKQICHYSVRRQIFDSKHYDSSLAINIFSYLNFGCRLDVAIRAELTLD